MISISSPSQFNSSKIPNESGVYIFKSRTKEVLYIGKAKNLRSRICCYFSGSDNSEKTKQLVHHIRDIDWIVVDNEVEALLLENKLVKKYIPKYNIALMKRPLFVFLVFSCLLPSVIKNNPRDKNIYSIISARIICLVEGLYNCL